MHDPPSTRYTPSPTKYSEVAPTTVIDGSWSLWSWSLWSLLLVWSL